MEIAMHGAVMPIPRWHRALAAAALLLSTALIADVAQVAAQAQTRIVASMVAHGPPQWPQYIAAEFGWLKDDKIELDLISAGASGVQQLAGGAINIAHSGFPDFVRASLQGAPVKIIINDIVAPPYAVFAKPNIKRAADLRGKLISIGGVKDVTLIYLKAFLAPAGLQASDVDFVYAKAAGDRFSALVSGGVDATLLNPPTYFKATALGFSNLGDIEPHMKDVPFTVWAANTDWAAKNRSALVAFARNYARSVRWLYDPANKDAAVDILVRHARQDRKDSIDAYDYLVTKLRSFGVDGGLPDAAYRKMADGLIDLGDMKEPVPPKSAIFDGSFVEQAVN
jgi:ABC-type nitrate/sulfonate/bicarbonate transport system substrate-binding protein